jgi:hypothetical protein
VPRRSLEYGCWPADDQVWLLRAALLDGDEARHAWHRWTQSVDLDTIEAGSLRLLPILYRNMRRLDIDSPALGRIQGVVRQTWYKNHLVVGRLADLLRECRAAGLPTMVLKGVPVAIRYYGDLSLRPMADADLLVPAVRALEALPLVRAAGWRPMVVPIVWPPRWTASCAFVNDLAVELDLHDHVMQEGVGAADDDEFWAAAEPIEVGGEMTMALGPADQLLHTIVHGFRRSTVSPVRWVADATMVIRGAGERLSWDRLIAQARRRRLSRIVARSLRYLVDAIQVAIPEAAMSALESTPSSIVERVECWARTKPGAARLVAEGWCDYARARARTDDWLGALGAARYLRDRLRTPSLWRVPGAAASIIASAARTSTPRRRG